MRLEPPVRATPILFLHLAGQLQFSSAGAGFEPASLSHACDLILAARRSCRSVFDAAPLRLFVRLGSPNPPCHWLRIDLDARYRACATRMNPSFHRTSGVECNLNCPVDCTQHGVCVWPWSNGGDHEDIAATLPRRELYTYLRSLWSYFRPQETMANCGIIFTMTISASSCVSACA